MSRLLFAAARGARVQRNLVGMADVWTGALELPADERDFAYQFRIHPDDEHLQYGPISTALREMAETGKDPHTLSSLMALSASRYECDPYCPFGLLPEPKHFSLFLLILAEALADEGL